jgi:hypothetical protein
MTKAQSVGTFPTEVFNQHGQCDGTPHGERPHTISFRITSKYLYTRRIPPEYY